MVGVIYARYSEGPKQTDPSIEGQVADCMAYAEQNGIEVAKVYADRHVSGKSTAGRDEFLQMIRDVQEHLFEAVIVWKIDRFGRSRQDIAINKMKLKKAGVKLYYAQEAVPEGPEGIILESVLEGLAEYYSADLRQKVYAALVSRLSELEGEEKELQKQIRAAEIERPMLSREVIAKWLDSFRDGDVDDEAFCARLLDTFVADVVLTNEEITIFYNITKRTGSRCSSTVRLVEQAKRYLNTLPVHQPVVFGPYIILRIAA